MANPTRTLASSRQVTPKRTVALGRKIINNPVYADLKGQAMITMSYDDGFNNNYDIAVPLHEKYNIPATFNIIGKRVIDPSYWSGYVDDVKVRDIDRRGFEIGSHSYYHDINLTDKPDGEVHFEMSESLKILSSMVKRIETIAIPFSAYDARIRAIAMQYYRAVRVGGTAQQNYPPADRYEIRVAYYVTNTTTFDQVKSVIDAAVTNKKWCIIMLHGIDPLADSLYEITPNLLEQILQYIGSFGRNTLLPVNMRDGIRFAMSEGDYVPS